nr:lipid II flippase MurJ [Kineococcus siccus]
MFAFSQTVGDTCLGTAYQTANQVPNVLFEVVAGGALAGVLVPLLSARLASADPAERAAASRTASAALTWSVTALVVVAALTAVLARPVLRLLLGDAGTDCGPDLLRTSVVMLHVFLPQVPLYAVAIVFAGVLQAQQRFTAPAAAPLVSSLVVGAAYVVVGGLVPAAVVARGDLDAVPGAALAVLAGGTTLGVLALAATHAPALRSGVRWRPTWRPAPGDGARLRSLALSGLTVVLAQQVVAVAVTRLTNDAGDPGAVNRWSYAWALFLLPYAVLAVPVATAVFPRLSRAAGAEFADLVARAARTVVLVCTLGAAVLAAVAGPVAVVFVSSRVGSGRTGDLSTALVVFAPGLLGYGLLTLLTRALYSAGRGRAAATGTVAGWGLVLVAAVGLAALLPDAAVVTAVAAAHSLGLTLGAVLLARSLRGQAGPAATAGVPRAVLAGVAAAVAGALAGTAVARVVPTGSVVAAVGVGVLAAGVAAVVWLVVVRLLDARDLGVLTGSARAVVRGGRS